MITFLHILVAIFLFFLINIIGKFAPVDLKYFQISNFLETDEAPAFNFSFRVLTPVVFIIILSAILYYFNMDIYVEKIYFICIYYVIFRIIFNILVERVRLVNWRKQFIYSIAIIALSYFAYTKFIINKQTLLPDFSSISNELWIIILIFLYTLVNNIPASDNGAEKRKLEYIKAVYSKLKSRYSSVINSITNNNTRLEQIIYAIIIHENFNRPRFFRLFEYLNSVFNKKQTYGIMQVLSDRPLSDIESVKKGSNIILKNFEILIPEFKSEMEIQKENENKYSSLQFVDDDYQLKLIRSFNHCDDYSYEIIELADYINEKFYGNKENNRSLFASV